MLTWIILGFLVSSSYGNGDIVLQKPSTNVRPSRNICILYPDWTVIAHQTNCQKFYMCANGEAEEFECAANYYFNRTEMRCLPGTCKNERLLQQRTCALRSSTIERVEGNCRTFTWCYNGILEHMRCSEGYYFDATNEKCQPAQPDVFHQCSCILPEHTVVANRDDCQTFYQCAKGKALLQRCPQGKYFNARINTCLPDLKGVCVKQPTLNELETAISDVCRKIGSAGAVFQPHPKDCSKFFLCINGHVFQKDCPNGHYFDSNSRFCRLDKDKKCEKVMAIREEGNKHTQSKKALTAALEYHQEKPKKENTKAKKVTENERNEKSKNLKQKLEDNFVKTDNIKIHEEKAITYGGKQEDKDLLQNTHSKEDEIFKIKGQENVKEAQPQDLNTVIKATAKPELKYPFPQWLMPQHKPATTFYEKLASKFMYM